MAGAYGPKMDGGELDRLKTTPQTQIVHGLEPNLVCITANQYVRPILISKSVNPNVMDSNGVIIVFGIREVGGEQGN